jgi:hypothetical protein
VTNRKLISVLILLFILTIVPDIAECAPQKEAQKVYVGMYVNSIRDINIKENSFGADIWLWFLYKRDPQKPFKENDKGFNYTFEIINTEVGNRSSEGREVYGDTVYEYARMIITVHNDFDMRGYPIDRHRLEISIEDTYKDNRELVFVPDVRNTSMNPDMPLTGWKLDGFKIWSSEYTYRTNFGNPSLPAGYQEKFSRCTLSVYISKPVIGSFLMVSWPTILATIIALLALFINPKAEDPRFGLGVGAFFAVMANYFVIASALPERHQFILADAIQMLSIFIIFLTLLESVISYRLVETGTDYNTKVRKMDIIFFFILTSVYVAMISLGIILYT